MSTISENIYNDLKNISLMPHGKEKAFQEYCKENLGLIEKLHFDYKEKQDRSNSKLSDNDKKNLAKAVSGFANSGGGVLIWGIEDATLKPKPIQEIVDFVRNIQLTAVNSTESIVPNIESGYISEDGINGYCYIFIPESDLVPHRIVLSIPEVKNHYYIRTGETFIVASHIMLEDMFGRRPKPKISLFTKFIVPTKGNTIVKGTIIVGIKNNGRGVAKSPYLAISFNQYYSIGFYGIDGNRKWGLEPLPKALEDDFYRYGSGSNIVIHPGVEYPITSIDYNVDIRETYEGKPDLNIKYQICAEGIQLIEGEVIISAKTIFHQVV